MVVICKQKMKLQLNIILNCAIKMGQLFCLSPLDSSNEYKYQLLTKIGQYLFIMNLAGQMIPYVCMIIYDSSSVIQGLSDLAVLINCICDFIFLKNQRGSSQSASIKALLYTARMNEKKKAKVEECFNRYLHLLILIVASCTIATLSVLACPIYLPQTLPLASSEYFLKKYNFIILHCIIYFLQIILMIQITGLYWFIVVSILILLSTATTKLDILASKIENIRNEHQLRKCIQEHQKIIQFVQNFRHRTRFIIFKVCVSIAISGIFTIFQILFPKHIYDIPRVLFFIIGSFLGVYLFSWAADDMHRASTNISQVLYHLQWTKFSSVMRKSMIIMMCRAQKPLRISVSGFLPELRLEFVTKFLMMVISYYMGLRELVHVR